MTPLLPRRGARPDPPTGPKPTDAHDVTYYVDEDGDAPGRDYLNSVPPKIAARLRAVVAAVAAAPPIRFSGGGLWEAMHADMTGWFEVRVNGPGRMHYRLYCLLDYAAQGVDKPLLVIVDGRTKPFGTTLTAGEYAAVRVLGDRYWQTQPRPLL